jgi:hypothetical protein
MMQQNGLKRLAGDFAGSQQFGERFLYGSIFHGELWLGLLLVTMIENEYCQAFRFHIGQAGDDQSGIHMDAFTPEIVRTFNL